MSERIPPFSAENLQAACKVLGDTSLGLTGSEIGYLLQDTKVVDVTPEITKWKRLFNALAEAQNTHQIGNHLIMFINRAMNPVSYARERQAFEWRRDELNVVLAFSGYYIRDDGKVIHSSRESTLDGARARAGRMRAALEQRNVHPEVLKYCRAEFIQENYFHAVLEAVKGVAERLRSLSGLASDGAELVNDAFGIRPCGSLRCLPWKSTIATWLTARSASPRPWSMGNRRTGPRPIRIARLISARERCRYCTPNCRCARRWLQPA
jgi:hypothetical protein